MNIGGIEKCSLVDYPGKLAAVVFSRGCNLNCAYCHNYGLLSDEDEPANLSMDEILAWLERRRRFLDAVVVSGGEPTLQRDLQEFIKQVRALGYLVKLDTNGTRPRVLEALLAEDILDYVAMDAKASPETYASVVRCAASFDVVRKSIALLLEGRVACEFRTTVLPTFTLDDIEAIAREVQGASLYVLQQFRSALTDPLRAAALRDMPPHPAQWFADAARRAAPFVESCTLRGVDVPLAALADPSAA